jgi:hypothetical protein
MKELLRRGEVVDIVRPGREGCFHIELHGAASPECVPAGDGNPHHESIACPAIQIIAPCNRGMTLDEATAGSDGRCRQHLHRHLICRWLQPLLRTTAIEMTA